MITVFFEFDVLVLVLVVSVFCVDVDGSASAALLSSLNAWPSGALVAASATGAAAAESEIASSAQISTRAARFCQLIAPVDDTRRAYLLRFDARQRQLSIEIVGVDQRKP